MKNAPVTLFRMNTYKSLDLKSLCFQHLQKTGGGGVIMVNQISDELARGTRGRSILIGEGSQPVRAKIQKYQEEP